MVVPGARSARSVFIISRLYRGFTLASRRDSYFGADGACCELRTPSTFNNKLGEAANNAMAARGWLWPAVTLDVTTRRHKTVCPFSAWAIIGPNAHTACSVRPGRESVLAALPTAVNRLPSAWRFFYCDGDV